MIIVLWSDHLVGKLDVYKRQTLAIIAVPSALSFFMDPVYGGYWYLFVGLAALTVVNIIFSALHPLSLIHI